MTKPVEWVGSSYKDFTAFPDLVQDTMGYALYMAQTGRTHAAAKPLKGFGGAGVLEIIEDDRDGTYRTVYTVKFERAVYVLHAFQKKSKRGIQTPREELEVIRRRLRIAEQDVLTRRREKMKKKAATAIRRGTKNIFADLGYADADTHLLKAQLMSRVQDTLTARKLNQTEAARIMGVSQPDVSRMLKGQFRDMSVERMLRMLARLGCDVGIVVRQQGRRKAFIPIHVEAVRQQ